MDNVHHIFNMLIYFVANFPILIKTNRFHLLISLRQNPSSLPFIFKATYKLKLPSELILHFVLQFSKIYLFKRDYIFAMYFTEFTLLHFEKMFKEKT